MQRFILVVMPELEQEGQESRRGKERGGGEEGRVTKGRRNDIRGREGK